MRPSPEIVTVGRRARYRSWGDTIGAPALLALIGLPMLAGAIAIAMSAAPDPEAITWLLIIGAAFTAAALVTLTIAITLRIRLARQQAELEARIDQLADMLDGDSRIFALERIALLCSLRASRRRRLFDLDLWDRATGDRSPRVIVLHPMPVPTRPVESPHEEIDLESEASVPRRKLVRQLITCGVVLAVGGALWLGALYAGAGSAMFAAILTLGGLIAAWQALARSGWRPVAIRSTVASPGRIEFGSLTGSRVFTPDDTLLLLSLRTDTDWITSSERLTMTFLRADGATRILALSGPDDPRISEAVARWTRF